MHDKNLNVNNWANTPAIFMCNTSSEMYCMSDPCAQKAGSHFI